MINRLENIEKEYKERVSNILANDFELSLLSAAFNNLQVKGPLRFNNFAYSIRELLRHTLYRLSPNEEVSKCDWFKPDISSSIGITRYQRIKYAIQGGLSDFYITKRLKIYEIDEAIKELVETFKALSGYTHIEPKTFDIGEKEVEKLTIKCLGSILWIIEKINETREVVFEALANEIDKELLNRIVSESVTEIMELSTHQFIEDINSDGGHVEIIGPKSFLLKVTGQIDCELQYGSSSDIRRGDGGIINTSFPFTGTLHVKFKAPLGSAMTMNEFDVDVSNWYE